MEAVNKTAPQKKKLSLAKRLALIVGAALFIAGCIPKHYYVLDGGTTIERNGQIGGHRSGETGFGSGKGAKNEAK